MFLCDLMLLADLFCFGKCLQFCKFPVDGLLELEVENYSPDSASLVFYPRDFLLIEPVEGGVVPSFAGLDEAVIEPLIGVFPFAFRRDQSLASVCERPLVVVIRFRHVNTPVGKICSLVLRPC